jgi:hypothetical protein
MKNAVKALILISLMSACIPDNIKEQMDVQMLNAQFMLADWQFKKALAEIELHKLRNGSYPNSLSDLEFLTPMDSSMSNFVEYTRLDSVYELNLKMEFPSLDGKETKRANLQYPPAFWKGLGCVKSNAK